MAKESKKIIVIGGRGALGNDIVVHFKQKNVFIVSVDHGENDAADLKIVVNVETQPTSESQADLILGKLKESGMITGNTEDKVFDAIICVAGGWAGGNITEKGFLKSVELMWKQSVESSVVAAFLAGKVLKDDGLLVLTGAEAALGPTGGMIGYGMAKAAVHHLIRSLACENSGLSKNAKVVGILPRMLNTPNNRKFATDQDDFTSWTPLGYISGMIDEWMTTNVVKSGTLSVITTKDAQTSVRFE